MKPVVAAIALLALLPVASAIYGGTEAPEGAYPWMAHLYAGDVSDPNTIVCGGTLIAPRYVLTAGHCIPTPIDETLGGPTPFSGHPALADYRILLGRADLEGEGGEIHRVVAQHSPYVPGVGSVPHGALAASDDLAVLELAEPSAYDPIRLADEDDVALYAPGVSARVLGWGVQPDGTFPTRLLQVDVPVWSDEACGSALDRPQYAIMFHPSSEVCAGSPGHDSCGGDSGGPLFVRDATGAPVEFGVVSYGAFTDCGDTTYPGVYQEIVAYRAFLDAFVS